MSPCKTSSALKKLKSKEFFIEPTAGNPHVWFCGGWAVNWMTPISGDRYPDFYFKQHNRNWVK
jgi:hypothetical protein